MTTIYYEKYRSLSENNNFEVSKFETFEKFYLINEQTFSTITKFAHLKPFR